MGAAFHMMSLPTAEAGSHQDKHTYTHTQASTHTPVGKPEEAAGSVQISSQNSGSSTGATGRCHSFRPQLATSLGSGHCRAAFVSILITPITYGGWLNRCAYVNVAVFVRVSLLCVWGGGWFNLLLDFMTCLPLYPCYYFKD